MKSLSKNRKTLKIENKRRVMKNYLLPFPPFCVFRFLVQQKTKEEWTPLHESNLLRWYNQLSMSYPKEITPETLDFIIDSVASKLILPF